jgi:hypothetical protein
MLHDAVVNLDAFKRFADCLKNRNEKSISREDLFTVFSDDDGRSARAFSSDNSNNTTMM